MSSIKIENNNASIKITIGTLVRNVVKAQALEVSVIKTNVLKIDLVTGPLYSIYLAYPDVILPVTTSPETLRDAILLLLVPANISATVNTDGLATDLKQTDELSQLALANTNVVKVNNAVLSLNTLNNTTLTAIAGVTAQINIVINKINDLQQRTDDANTAIASVNTKVDQATTTIANNGASLDSINTTVAQITAAVSTLNDSITVINTTVQDIDSKVTPTQ